MSLKNTNEIMKNREGQAKAVLRGMMAERRETPEYNFVPVDDIVPGRYQPRKRFRTKELEELADSIKEAGVIQPIKVRPIRDGKYELIFGERRWRAAKLAGIKKIPAIVVMNMPDEKLQFEALIENLHRDNLTAREKAEAINNLNKKYPNIKIEEIAKKLGCNRKSIQRWMNTLRLPKEIYDQLYENGFTQELYARALTKVRYDRELMEKLKDEIIIKKLTTHEAIKMAEEMAATRSPFSKILQSLKELSDSDIDNESVIDELKSIIKVAKKIIKRNTQKTMGP